jgi:predicted transcriptional regulator
MLFEAVRNELVHPMFRGRRGIVMVPPEKLRALTECLEEKRVRYTVRNVWT